MNSWLKKAIWIAAIFSGVFVIVALDVVFRARHAFLEGEKCWAAGDYKTAYSWYESAATLFTPPDSPWAKRARQKLPDAKERWKANLQAKGISVDDLQFE